MSPEESDRLAAEAGERLAEERPLPDPEFRARLREDLLAHPGEQRHRRPALAVASLAAAGGLLLLLAAAGAAGVGPVATG
jgi:hypothetical protein